MEETQKKRPSRAWRLFRGLLIVGFICAVAGAVVGAVLWHRWTTDEPLPDVVDIMESVPAQATIFLDRNGQEVGRGGEKRIVLDPQKIPPVIQATILAAEDKRFFSHIGFDPIGIGKAFLRGLKNFRFQAGGSTITQQLAKRWVGNERSLRRKVRELAVALRVERRYSKEQILARYLNLIDFGGEHFGIEEAARYYFGKPASEVNLSEAALLAALPKAPGDYPQPKFHRSWKERRNYVLNRMVENGWAPSDLAKQAAEMPIVLAKKTEARGDAPECVDAALAQLKKGGFSVQRTGGSVQLSCDRDLQISARTASQEMVREVDRLNGRWLPAPEVAVVALDVESGDVLAIVGSSNYQLGDENIAIKGRRQAGSTFKPVVLAAGLESGKVTNTTSFYDVVKTYNPGGGAPPWTPQNYHGEHLEGLVTLRVGLAHSINTVFAQLMEAIGPKAVVEMGKRLGVTTPLRADFSLTLGTSEVSLLELTNAYRVFANRGRHSAPRFVKSVDSRPWPSPPTKRAISEALAFVATSAMTSVVDEGAAQAAKKGLPGWVVAGKTGTTNGSTDVYFVGYTRNLVVGVWLGHKTPTNMGAKMTGARLALPVWIKVMQAGLKNQSPQGFGPAPYGVEVVGGEAYLAGTTYPNAPVPTLYPGATVPADLPPSEAGDGGSVSPDGGSEIQSPKPAAPTGAAQDSDYE